ncbi:MAG: bL35 family ribosomal protein [bacterium]
MKQKIRKSLSKRIRVTGTGKVIRRAQNMRHLRANKTKSQVRRMKATQFLSGATKQKILKMLGKA